ncbi:FHA domain-containing protein, partial [Chamaesiphon sp. OTE_20_metabat_361]|uniref:FHA domain-containing protein n=1 Tax=Chamaesiphon sp. OTE_20_metabat_361 TaxID=2964689 RepID=UPI00286BCEC9
MKNIQISLWDERETHILQQWQFFPPTPIQIGRSPEREIAIDRPSISRLHATISYTSLRQGGGYWELSNQGTNGTLVNDLSIERVLLTTGDRVKVSPEGALLTIELDVVASAPSAPPSPVQPAICKHSDNPPNILFCQHCGEPIAFSHEIHQYQILKTLGQGG